MTSEENGKVTVTTEPVKNEMNIEDTEVIKPLSAADKDIIANNDGEDGEEVLDDTAIDFDEINDKDLDKLGEKYFTKVYDNVKSFKSTAYINAGFSVLRQAVHYLVKPKSDISVMMITTFIFEQMLFRFEGTMGFHSASPCHSG